MDKEVAHFMVFMVEQVAKRYFAGDRVRAYAAMRDSGLWAFFSDTYETSHALSVEYLMDDARRWLDDGGVELAALSR